MAGTCQEYSFSFLPVATLILSHLHATRFDYDKRQTILISFHQDMMNDLAGKSRQSSLLLLFSHFADV